MRQFRIKHFTYYFRRMMKFYDLKANVVPQVLFVLFLVVSFGFRVLAQPTMMDYNIYFQQMYNTLAEILSADNVNTQLQNVMQFQNSEVFMRVVSISLKVMGIFAIQQILMALLSFFYLGGYLVDLESKSPTFSAYVNKFFKALPRYLLFNIIFYVAIIVVFFILVFIMSLAVLVLPGFAFVSSFIIALIPMAWFIVQVMFIFKDTTFLDTGVSLLQNFKTSLKLSKGYRFIIARNIIFISFLNLIIGRFTIESQLVSMFIVSFFEVIIILIRQRLVALMYIGRTRKPKDEPEISKV